MKARVLDLLNTNILNAGTWAPTIPARTGNVNPPALPDLNPVPGLGMLSPAPETYAFSGVIVPVVVETTNGFNPTSIVVVSNVNVAEIDPVTLTGTLTIPESAVGPVTLYAFGVDANSNIAETQQVTIQVIPPSELQAISIDPSEMELTRDGPSELLSVTGHFKDNIDRDLTLGVLGTTYQSSDVEVATVTVDGLVTSVGFGSCTITASNGGFEAVAEVDVTGLPCTADVNYDNAVNVDDWTEVILNWGPCYPCAADIIPNGVVDIDDFTEVILQWGPCPSPPSLTSPEMSDPLYTCIGAIKLEQYMEVLSNGTEEEVDCWNCWAYRHLRECVGETTEDLPECGCADPF